MSVYKPFTTSDIVVTPFKVNKSFSFQGPEALIASNVGIDRFKGINHPITNFWVSGSNPTGDIASYNERLVYDSIKQLYYSNYLKFYTVRFIDIMTGTSSLSRVATYGFNPNDSTAASYVNPNYSGTVADISGTGTEHILYYYFDRDQSNFSVNISSVEISTQASTGIYERETADIIGRWYGGSDPSVMGAEKSNLIGLGFLKPPAGLQLPDALWYSMWLSVIGVFAGIGLFYAFQSAAVAMAMSAAPIVVGSFAGIVPIWYAMIIFLLLMSTYSINAW